jgi:hypothetical protein
MPPAVPALSSRVASGSDLAQLLAHQQQQQAAPLPAAPERPAVQWLSHDPSALRPVKRGVSVADFGGPVATPEPSQVPACLFWRQPT